MKYIRFTDKTLLGEKIEKTFSAKNFAEAGAISQELLRKERESFIAKGGYCDQENKELFKKTD